MNTTDISRSRLRLLATSVHLLIITSIILHGLLHNGRVLSQENEQVSKSDGATDVKLDPDLGSTKHASRTDADVVKKEEEAIRLDGLSPAEVREMRNKMEKVHFQTEVDRMMKLIINSLYKNKEIFLRELISNASDALDKIQFHSITNSSALEATTELSIKIKIDHENRMLHIIDTGIGMTKEDLLKNLGTIAKSGTKDFMEKLGGASEQETNDLIGQFGVGFYSAFLVADKVYVTTKHNDDIQYIWESDSRSFSVVPDPRGNTLKRGTTISLLMKEEAGEYMDERRLKELINKYSQFIEFDIFLWQTKKVKVEVDDDEEAEEEEEVEEIVGDVDESGGADGQKKKERKKKIIEETVFDWVKANDNRPIWRERSSDLTDAEYDAFYRSLTKDREKPIGKVHFSAEGGEAEFKSILYIPRTAPRDMFHDYRKNFNFIKLYVRRVFITDSLEDLMPKYLSFIRGVVDSDDLPLNVSREELQQHKLLAVIKKKLIRKAIEMIAKLDGEAFARFWAEYSTNIKVGIVHDAGYRARLGKLLRFRSTHNMTDMTSLADYVSRMLPEQDQIYYMAGQSISEVDSSPFMEGPKHAGVEVLYLVDPIDEHTVMSLGEFGGRQIQSVAKEGLRLPTKGGLDSAERRKAFKEEAEKEFAELLKWLKDDALKNKILKATVSDTLRVSPCTLVCPSYGWSGSMERIQAAEAHQKEDEVTTKFYQSLQKILDLNVRHPVVKGLKTRLNEFGPNDATSRHLANVLYETARLVSGYALEDISDYAESLEKMTAVSLGISMDFEVEDNYDEELEEAERYEDFLSSFEDENKQTEDDL